MLPDIFMIKRVDVGGLVVPDQFSGSFVGLIPHLSVDNHLSTL